MDTPVRLPNLVPELHIEPQKSGDWYLQASPELCMKRILAAGISKIFQICKCFRKNERGNRHLPELTMLEWYSAGNDYWSLMDDCENLLRFIADRLAAGNQIEWKGNTIDLSQAWERLTLSEAFNKYSPLTLEEALKSDRFEEALDEYVEPCLGKKNPVFVYDYPASLGSLARLNKNNPKVAERFELYICGLELANGFSELVDPVEQRNRFQKERKMISDTGRDPGPMPEKFLQDLEDMPETAGIALGIDRLVMLFAGCQSIDEVVAFTPEEL